MKRINMLQVIEQTHMEEREYKSRRVKNFKVGTIVRCTTNAVLVTGKGNTKETGYPCFAGVVVMAIFNGEDGVWPVGMFSDTWTLDAFKKIDIDISSMIAGWLSVDEKMAMYMKLSKKKLAEMLIDRSPFPHPTKNLTELHVK